MCVCVCVCVCVGASYVVLRVGVDLVVNCVRRVIEEDSQQYLSTNVVSENCECVSECECECVSECECECVCV